jgi:hypothetical protein
LIVVSMAASLRPAEWSVNTSLTKVCQSLTTVCPIVWQKDLIVEPLWDTCGQTFTLEYDFAGIAQLVEHLICNKLLCAVSMRVFGECGLRCGKKKGPAEADP